MDVKVIYCWFGGNQLPEAAKNYLLTWQQQLPTVSVVAVSEANFDVTCNQYVQEAYTKGKFAFVSDYARLAYLYEHGGIYLDTDVEVRQDLVSLYSETDLVVSLEYFEWELTGVNTGTIIAPPHHPVIAELLATYENEVFIDHGAATQTINQRLTNVLLKKGLLLENVEQHLAGVTVYPYEYFCTDNPKAYAVHHYASSWHEQSSVYRKIRRRIGKWMKQRIGRERFAKIWPPK
ncbi:MAG: glycosyltransferase family 32 protein [Culicoidibacterales bacterium]